MKTSARNLPRFVRDLLASVPTRGQGLNNWLFRTARVLHPYRERDEIVALLNSATAGEAIKAGEIERAVDNSAAVAWQPLQPTAPSPGLWPKVNHEQREAVVASSGGLVDLWELSPTRLEDAESHTEQIIDRLFPGNPLLCCGASSWLFKTRLREEWRGRLAEQQVIVPSPMASVWGTTKEGTKSQHTLSNTGPRRFLVIEQDAGSLDDQAGVLLHLAKIAPLALALHSGGKSIHGWFACNSQPEWRLRAFMRKAVELGADHALWTPSQFVRMPDGTREGGARQTVYYFNPEVVK
jgi:hypothetical protein